MHGAVAIVEMNIVASGRRFLVVGGGSFPKWLVNVFRNKTNSDQKMQNLMQKWIEQHLVLFITFYYHFWIISINHSILWPSKGKVNYKMFVTSEDVMINKRCGIFQAGPVLWSQINSQLSYYKEFIEKYW